MFGTKLFDSLKDVEGVNVQDLQQARDAGNRMDQLTQSVSGWADNLGGISTLAINVPVAQLFSETLAVNSTGISVKFNGSKYSFAMLSGSVLWDEPSTGLSTNSGDSLMLQFNGDTSTDAYRYLADQAWGSTADGFASSAFGNSTIGATVLTGWLPSSESDNTIPHTFLAMIPGMNSTVKKTGTILYDLNGIVGMTNAGLVSHLAFWYNGTSPINSFDFSLINEHLGAGEGYMLPGSHFSAWGFK